MPNSAAGTRQQSDVSGSYKTYRSVWTVDLLLRKVPTVKYDDTYAKHY